METTELLSPHTGAVSPDEEAQRDFIHAAQGIPDVLLVEPPVVAGDGAVMVYVRSRMSAGADQVYDLVSAVTSRHPHAHLDVWVTEARHPQHLGAQA